MGEEYLRRVRRLAVIALLLGGCAADAAPPDVSIAFGRDFEGFRDWIAFDRGVDTVPPTHDGQTWIYADRLPEEGALTFEIGTRILRVEERGDDPTSWELHAMVKRGGGYNAAGAAGWEFFGLALDPEGTPFIVWRGEGPPSGDGYRPPDGSDTLFGCNHCHGSAAATDSVLSPALDLLTR